MVTDSRIGTTIAGYRIESMLGRGGSNWVCRGRSVQSLGAPRKGDRL